MNGVIGLAGILALLLGIGAILGLANRRNFSLRWLLVAALLVAVNDALLTRFYGIMPDLLDGSTRNWQGKLLALATTLAIAAHPAFGWRKAGFTVRQAVGSLEASLPVLALYCAFFLAIALAFASGTPTAEEAAFQLTMPGFEEEPFYRGLLLLALDRAFTGRARFLGVDWGWGAVLSCLLFGLAHAFGYSSGRFTFDAITMALTALPAFMGVWLRLRTDSVLLPILAHNFGNSVSLVV